MILIDFFWSCGAFFQNKLKLLSVFVKTLNLVKIVSEPHHR